MNGTEEELRSPRTIAIERIAQRAAQFPDLGFEGLDTASLSGRDAGLARAIDAAVARRWLTLVAVLESRIERPWPRVEAPLQAALLVGAAQLLLFDRIPDHAAVDESVEWAKRTRGPRSAGFVNAVLRKVAGLKVEVLPRDSASTFGRDRDLLPLADGRAWKLSQPVFSADMTIRIGQIASVGRELFLHWVSAHGFPAATELARHNLVDPPTLVTGLPEELRCDACFLQHQKPGWHVWQGEPGDLVPLLAEHPALRVQDPTSGDPVAAAVAAGLAPKVILDFCAGRGTKTVQLAAAFPKARVLAADPDEARRKDLSIAASRFANIEVVEPDRISSHFQSADLVVLDVPCSNTGVLPRRPEAAYRFTAKRLEKLVEKQRGIAAGAFPLLKPGGTILYATCSLEPAENGRQAAWLRKHHRLGDRGERQRFPTGLPGDPPTSYSDGGFWSLLVQSGP